MVSTNEWDGDKANDYFYALWRRTNVEGAKYNSYKSSLHKKFYDIELANFDLYADCADNAWTRERFANFLDRKRSIPNTDAFDSEKYLEYYNSELENIKTDFKSGELLQKILSN
jgi:tellurite resistance protein